MTWLRLAASPQLAGIVALTAAASLGACHLIGGAGDLTFEDGVGGSGAGSTGTTAGGGNEGLPLGTECSVDTPDDCASGFCVDGVCCDTVCDGACFTCAAPDLAGTCSPDIGAPCADGVCDAGRRCATGEADFVLLCGDANDNFAGRGALRADELLLSGSTGSIGTGLQFGPDISVGKTDGNHVAFVASMSAMQMGEARSYGNGDGQQDFTHIAVFPDGGYVVAGTFTGTFTLPPPINTISTVGMGPEVVVIAFDAMNTPQWSRVFVPGGTANAGVLAIAANASQVALAVNDQASGMAKRTLLTLDRTSGSGAGTATWELGTNDNEGQLTALAYDPGGALWASGWAVSEGFIGEGPGGQKTLPQTLDRVIPVLVRYDASLNITAGPVAIGTAVDVRPTAIAVSDDSVVVAGVMANGVLAQPAVGDGTVDLMADASGEDPFVLELDHTGLARWGRVFASNVNRDENIGINGVARDAEGDVVFTGTLLAGNISFGAQTVAAGQQTAGYVAKVLPGGQLAWYVEDSSNLVEITMRWVGIDSAGSAWVMAESFGNAFGQSELGSADVLVMKLAP